MNYKATIIILAFISLIAGCSVKNVSPYKFKNIKYGNSIQEIEHQLSKDGLPLFKFATNSKEYIAVAYDADGTYKNYIFLYEDNKLISIIHEFTGIQIWSSVFGNYDHNLPNSTGLSEIVELIKTDKIIISEYDFSHVNKYKKDQHNKMLKEALIANTMMPLGLMAIIYASPIIGPYSYYKYSTINKSSSSLINKANSLHYKSTPNNAVNLLGEPSHTLVDNDQEVYVFYPDIDKTYQSNYAISIGYTKNELSWLGYYYDASKVK